MKVYFVGAGPGDPELLTLRAKSLIEEADVIVYAGSLINPKILGYAKEKAELHDSSVMVLAEIIELMSRSVRENKTVVRLHSGDPSLYGAIGEQIRRLEEMGIDCSVIPGVSSFLAAAASLGKEYTLPRISQTVIVTRVEGKTGVPEAEKLGELAKHQASMCIFLSAHLMEKVAEELKKGYPEDAPAAIAYKVSWDDEKILSTTISNLSEKAEEAGITKTALVLVGDFLKSKGEDSKLYDKKFRHGFRGVK
jgi:precorrin-4/cobalt-precorrin-4 C11-methyltransferase